MRQILILLACLGIALYSVVVYQGYRETVRNLDMLGSYGITQEMSPAVLDYHLLPPLLEAIQAFKQTHGGQEPSHVLIRTSGVIDVECRTAHRLILAGLASAMKSRCSEDTSPRVAWDARQRWRCC
jgi:hypothetical protein